MDLTNLSTAEQEQIANQVKKLKAKRAKLVDEARATAIAKDFKHVKLDTIRHDGKAIVADCVCVDTGEIHTRKSSDWHQCFRTDAAKEAHDKKIKAAARAFAKANMDKILAEVNG